MRSSPTPPTTRSISTTRSSSMSRQAGRSGRRRSARHAPYIPVFDKSARTDGTFAREDLTYDHNSDVWVCPAGKMLTCTSTLVNDGATLLYLASKYDCDTCALKARCCPKAPARRVPRLIYEGARDMARDIAKSEDGRTSRNLRKRIEILFAHLKRILSSAPRAVAPCIWPDRPIPRTSAIGI